MVREAIIQPTQPTRHRRIFISTGEVSGDLQGSFLVEALYRQAAHQGMTLEILALGGDRMAQAGAKLLGNTTTIGAMGLIEALPYVLPTLKLQRDARRLLAQHPPDLVVLIDYIGPNINVGQSVRRQHPQVPIVYYIAPQEWVWSLNHKNTSQIVDITDHLLAVFPQEARYYEAQGAKVTWVGHPLLDQIAAIPDRATARAHLGIPDSQCAIVLSPASRRQELKYLLPPMFAAAQQIQAQFEAVHFWIPLALEIYRDAILAGIKTYGLRATIVPKPEGRIALAAADLAIAKSGTTNLEIALLNVPQVVIYRLNPLTAWFARRMLKFKIPFASPVNLVPMRAVVPELLQEDMTAQNIAQAAIGLICGPEREKMLQDYQEVRTRLGEVGVADRAAIAILDLLP